MKRRARKWKVDVAKCHACHANGRSMSPSATPATQNDGHQRKWNVKRKWNVNVTKYHACHANETSMSPSATPATQMERQCYQVPRLPCKVVRRPGRLTAPKRATRASRAPQVPRLPRKTTVKFLTSNVHFVRKGCVGHLKLPIFPQFLTSNVHFVRKGCI